MNLYQVGVNLYQFGTNMLQLGLNLFQDRIIHTEERLAMGRPVVQDMLDQFSVSPLLGLEYLVEVLQQHLEPRYHCALCNYDTNMSDLISHLTSLNHILTFIKEFFPVAWARFSSIFDFSTWLKSDFDCLDVVVNKIAQVHGRKRPTLVASQDKLDEVVEKLLETNAYSARKTELDTFFHASMTPLEPRRIVKKHKKVSRKPHERQVKVFTAKLHEDAVVASNQSIVVSLKLIDLPPN